MTELVESDGMTEVLLDDQRGLDQPGRLSGDKLSTETHLGKNIFGILRKRAFDWTYSNCSTSTTNLEVFHPNRKDLDKNKLVEGVSKFTSYKALRQKAFGYTNDMTLGS